MPKSSNKSISAPNSPGRKLLNGVMGSLIEKIQQLALFKPVSPVTDANFIYDNMAPVIHAPKPLPPPFNVLKELQELEPLVLPDSVETKIPKLEDDAPEVKSLLGNKSNVPQKGSPILTHMKKINKRKRGDDLGQNECESPTKKLFSRKPAN